MITTKKYFAGLFGSLTIIFCLQTQQTCADCTKSIVPTDMVIVKHVGSILKILDIPYQPNIDSITSVAIKLWKRQPEQERWEQNNIQITQMQQKNINIQLQKLGFISAVLPPKRRHFSCILIFGARVGSMKFRLEYAYKLIKQNKLQVDSIVILAGERALTTVDGKNEIDAIKQDLMKINYTKNINLIKTEADAAKLLLQILPLPSPMKYGVRVVSTGPVFDQKTGKMRRASTRDTLETWLNEYKLTQAKSPYKKHSIFKKSHILLVSSQPFVNYQHIVTESVLKNSNIQFNVIGPNCSTQTRLIEKLNAVASWLENRKSFHK